jgi:hypothetical protein
LPQRAPNRAVFWDADRVKGIEMSGVASGRAISKGLSNASFENSDFLNASYEWYDVIAAFESLYYLSVSEQETSLKKWPASQDSDYHRPTCDRMALNYAIFFESQQRPLKLRSSPEPARLNSNSVLTPTADLAEPPQHLRVVSDSGCFHENRPANRFFLVWRSMRMTFSEIA